MRTQSTIMVGLLATAISAATAWADSSSSSDLSATTTSKDSPKSSSTAAAGKKRDARDPVATAFRLPSGTKLNSKQQKAYDALKAKYERTLREAVDLLHSSDSTAKNKRLKLNRDTRVQIKTEIKDILSMGSADSQSAQQSAYGNSYGRQTSSGYGSGMGYTNGGGYSRPMGGPGPCGRR
jgi:hypothetical protein